MRCPPPPRACALGFGESNLLTRSPVDLALALFLTWSYWMVHPPSRLRAWARCHLLTLDGRFNLPILRSVDRITLSACTLYLVFKEPEARRHRVYRNGLAPFLRRLRCLAARHPASPRSPRRQPSRGSFLGEPSKTTERSRACQALISPAESFERPDAETWEPWKGLASFRRHVVASQRAFEY